MNSEPISPGAGQPQPFEQTPKETPGGCGKPLVVGCGVAVVLLGLLLLGVLWKAQDLMPALFRWSMAQFERQVAERLPPDLTEAERQRLADAFASAMLAVEEGTADPVALRELQPRLMETARTGRLSREEVLALVEALEAVAGVRAPPAEAPPQPAAAAA